MSKKTDWKRWNNWIKQVSQDRILRELAKRRLSERLDQAIDEERKETIWELITRLKATIDEP